MPGQTLCFAWQAKAPGKSAAVPLQDRREHKSHSFRPLRQHWPIFVEHFFPFIVNIKSLFFSQQLNMFTKCYKKWLREWPGSHLNLTSMSYTNHRAVCKQNKLCSRAVLTFFLHTLVSSSLTCRHLNECIHP